MVVTESWVSWKYVTFTENERKTLLDDCEDMFNPREKTAIELTGSHRFGQAISCFLKQKVLPPKMINSV